MMSVVGAGGALGGDGGSIGGDGGDGGVEGGRGKEGGGGCEWLVCDWLVCDWFVCDAARAHVATSRRRRASAIFFLFTFTGFFSPSSCSAPPASRFTHHLSPRPQPNIKNTCSISPSRVVPHRSTTDTRGSLTSLFGWEAVTLPDVAARTCICSWQTFRSMQSIRPQRRERENNEKRYGPSAPPAA